MNSPNQSTNTMIYLDVDFLTSILYGVIDETNNKTSQRVNQSRRKGHRYQPYIKPRYKKYMDITTL